MASDIARAIGATVGAPDKSVENARRLGAVQFQAANEWMSDLDCFAAQFSDVPCSEVSTGANDSMAPANFAGLGSMTFL